MWPGNACNVHPSKPKKLFRGLQSEWVRTLSHKINSQTYKILISQKDCASCASNASICRSVQNNKNTILCSNLRTPQTCCLLILSDCKRLRFTFELSVDVFKTIFPSRHGWEVLKMLRENIKIHISCSDVWDFIIFWPLVHCAVLFCCMDLIFVVLFVTAFFKKMISIIKKSEVFKAGQPVMTLISRLYLPQYSVDTLRAIGSPPPSRCVAVTHLEEVLAPVKPDHWLRFMPCQLQVIRFSRYVGALSRL